jgi:hypothetical protein
VIRSDNNKGLMRISLDQSSSFFDGRKKKKEDTRKKKFLKSAYINVGRCSLDICSQGLCQVFTCAIIHTAKRRACLVFEIWSYSQRGYNLDENQFLDNCVIQSACNVFMYLAII